jgi:hypothetical protein
VGINLLQILYLGNLRASDQTGGDVRLRSPLTNGKRFRVQFHSYSGFFQSPDSSLEWTARRPTPHQALESTDVFYRELRFRK